LAHALQCSKDSGVTQTCRAICCPTGWSLAWACCNLSLRALTRQQADPSYLPVYLTAVSLQQMQCIVPAGQWRER
jgi:hypothetical protein